ncbi:hypothetical protein MLD38_002999 [Melastoma candidum]|uniref:Uncharacterized protein n=1 Tax=Melastoma candidum TaxID=119954 RepID=A0ACB9S0N3_9MYRT|nr:hypothetical protein MLD38_002999 [Melastoma candidum]
MHTNESPAASDQDLPTHTIRSLANNHAGSSEKNISSLLLGSQDIQNGGQAGLAKSEGHEGPSVLRLPQAGEPSLPLISNAGDAAVGQRKLNNFYLNYIYVDSDDGMVDSDRSPVTANMVGNSIDCPPWMGQESHQPSPPQTSRNSDSASVQSPSSSSGDTQGLTDRIVFKLFGTEPNDFPHLLCSQILGWLSHSPTDIESHIRPGCVILTTNLRQPEDAWEELSYDMSSRISRLLDVSDDNFWKGGWMYIWVPHQIALIYEGNVVIEKSLPLMDMCGSSILSIRPTAVTISERSSKASISASQHLGEALTIMCFGRYLIQQTIEELVDGNDRPDLREEVQCVKISCSIAATLGRGFIETEDCGLPGSFFPFIVAEENVCQEIRTLKDVLEFSGRDTDARGHVEFGSEESSIRLHT